MKALPAGAQTTRADGAEWQKLATPGQSKWKQTKDGDKKPQSFARQNPVDGAGDALADATGSRLGYRMTQAKYDLDGFLPPEEIHPDHVDVDTDGDMDNKPVLAWEHEGQERRSYTMNFHQRKHRDVFGGLKGNALALSRASGKLLELHGKAADHDKDRYLAAHIIVASGHTPDQMLQVQHGHVGRALRKGGKTKLNMLLQHAAGRVFNWGSSSPELYAHFIGRGDRSPTSPLFACGPQCIASALDEVGLGDVPMQVIRGHAVSRMAVDLLSKSKRTKIDSYGAGLDKVRESIVGASEKIAAAYGHPPAPANMSYVPPHVQAAYLEAAGGGTVFKNTYETLNMRKSVRSAQEDTIWQHAEDQILKSKPSTIPLEEVPRLVAALFQTLMSKPSSPSLRRLLAKSTKPSQVKETKQGLTPTSPEEPSTLSSEHLTPPTTQPTDSSLLTPPSASQEQPPTSSSTTTPSTPTDSPTVAPSCTSEPLGTTGPSQESPSCSPTETSIQKSEMPTLSSPPSEVRTTFERPDSVDALWASILTKATQGIIGPAGLHHFAALYKGTDTKDGVTTFAVAVAEFLAVVTHDDRLIKAGSVAGTRGDPIGQIAVHADGSRWRKTGPGQWEREGANKPEKKEVVGKKGDRDSVRVSVLRARLKELRSRWQGATSTAQRSSVVKQLTEVKSTIRQLTSTGMKKSFSETEQDQLDALLIKANTLLTDWRAHLNEERVAKGDGYVPPSSVRAAARRGLELRRKHKRGGLDNKEAKKQGVGSGVQRASNLMHGHALSIQTVKRMRAFFSRHAQHGEHRQDKTSAAYISWMLWGGNAGRSWANRIVRQHEAKTTRKSMHAHKVTDIIDSYVHPQVQTNMIDDYLRETDMYDLRKSLTASDYIERILRDGGTTAAQARLYMLTHSASALAAHITTTLGKVRSDI